MFGGAAAPTDIQNEAMGGFGPLKAVLGAISTIYANYKVRSRSPTRGSFLTNPPAGNHPRQG